MTRWVLVVALALGSCAATACGDAETPTEPTDTSTTATGLVTETYTNNVRQGGATSRSFTTTAQGQITATLSSLSQESATIGLALGLSDEVSGTCARTYTILTQLYTGRSLSVTADAGRYCVTVYDVGDLAGITTFTVTLTHP